MSDPTPFELTLERIALIRRMVVAWNAASEGAPIIHPDAPYGSLDRDDDIFNVTGDDEGAEEEHRAMGDALAVFLQHAVLKPGRYQYHNPLAKLSSTAVSDVFRDGETGETPEHITFEVTPAHLALIPRLQVRWDIEADGPAIDPAQPYGAGVEPESERLHREMQPAMQIFLRYGDLAPGFFRKGAAGWETA
ncbi:hypothetical protein [Methylorubrum sp. POS3]|uniref:hypothetical protein n=1 Tax=Methylorubrum sp. POS3 TaxID=2998492 RepID=UPI00372B10BB